MKQVILVRKDLKMPKGKLAVQSSHAAVESAYKSSSLKLKKWHSEGSKKIILKVKDLDELIKYKRKAEKSRLKTALVTDAGRTFFKEPTVTCLAIGPDEDKKIDKITRKLKIL